MTVKAAYIKHRRGDTLPVQGSTTRTLARWRDELGMVDAIHPVFATMPEETAKMLRADLSDAGIEYRGAIALRQ